MDEIVNRVANSNLVTIDLEEFYPQGKRILIDLKDWLYEEQILKEKDFRAALKNHDWTQYEHAFVAIYCSVDALLPGWAYLLVSVYLQPYARKVVRGDLDELESILFHDIVHDFDVNKFRNKKVLLKGCSNNPIPSNAYVFLAQKLLPVAQSLMYGEACSSVPLYKRKP